MKASLACSILLVGLLAACSPPTEKTYFSDSPELTQSKMLFKAYLEGNFDEIVGMYTADAIILRNKWDADDAMNPAEYVQNLQAGLGPISSYSLTEPQWEMVINDEGEKWVHVWAKFTGEVAGNIGTFTFPIHVSQRYEDGKIAFQIDIFDKSELTTALMNTQNAAEEEMEELSQED